MSEFIKGAENLEVSDQDRLFVAEQLGREPRGLEAIQVRRDNGNPAVIRVASLVEGKPFPTLFWLVDPQLNHRISQLEAAGVIADMQEYVDQNDELQIQLEEDNRRYIRKREQLMSTNMLKAIRELDYCDTFKKKGVGGLGSFTRIRCLHTWYAAHLVQPNAIGHLFEAWEEKIYNF